MSVADYELLKQLSLNQAELARILGTSRQAVNIGIRNDDTYVNANRLEIVYRSFVAVGDPRQKITAKILLDKFSVEPDYSAGTMDILGLKLSNDRIRLILENDFLKNHLREVVAEIVETKCREFESLFAQDKRLE